MEIRWVDIWRRSFENSQVLQVLLKRMHYKDEESREKHATSRRSTSFLCVMA